MSIVFVEKQVEPVQHTLWSINDAPTQLNEIVGNTIVSETLQSFVRSRNLPNLLLCGPNGCGKTIMAQLTTKAYLGQRISDLHLEIMGSIHRGKNVITEKIDSKKNNELSIDCPNIIHFIKKSVNRDNSTPFKVITVYDFDCMTIEAQMALRRVIEINANVVRFIFICNNLSQVIEAIQSRVLLLKCQPITIDQMIPCLKTIAMRHNLQLMDNVYQNLALMAHGDLKQAINCMQLLDGCEQPNLETFYQLFNIPSIQTVSQLIQSCLNQQGALAINLLKQLIDNGYHLSDILDILINILIYNPDGINLSSAQKTCCLEETIKIITLNEETSSSIHLYRLIGNIIQRLR